MASRILFLLVITFTLGIFFMMTSGAAKFFWFLCMAGSVAVIFETVRTYKKLSLQDGALIITDSFGIERTVYLDEITSWQERKIYLQSSLRRSLVWVVKHENIVISNYDSIREYEKLFQLLKSTFPEREA